MLIKIGLLMLNILCFTFFYFFLGDSHFSGINSIQTLLKDEIIRKKVENVVEDTNKLSNNLGVEQFQNDKFMPTEDFANTVTDEKIEDIIVEEKEN